ncbi:hypothetical protein DID88_000127 [Monilinia fructigena]|uniref:DUF4105 domain-containing protein n=1 Tax=Monilinia fructigena TaxID=38457 RepID=A0A395IJI9_9HELO|nr:hypothetical protein DID88_000127 [Monilinia fructigena]
MIQQSIHTDFHHEIQTPILLLASFLAFVSSEADASHSHARDFSIEVRDIRVFSDGFAGVQKRNPVILSGKGAAKLHVWTRLNTRTASYENGGGSNHEGLNQLMKDTGGKHVDVIVDNTKEYKQYGLEFNDESWQSQLNGDGAKVLDYAERYESAAGEFLTYKGQIGDGRKKLHSIETVVSSLIKGKVYNHQSYNCATFANDLVTKVDVKITHKKLPGPWISLG